MQLKKPFLVLLIIGVILAGVDLASSARASTIKIYPAHLDIGTFFSGRRISLSGSVPADRDVVIEVRGPEEKSVFNTKGRVGPFWMNRGKFELEKAPFLYLLLLPEGAEPSTVLSSLGLGIKQLERKLAVKPDTVDLDVVFPRFVQLKESQHLYGELAGAVRYSPSTGGIKHFEALFQMPSSTVPGEYMIEARLVHDGKVEEMPSQAFTVKEVGFVKAVRELAYDSGLLYGILCVLIALFVGAVIGLLFQSKGAH
jgi:hypothetical protein